MQHFDITLPPNTSRELHIQGDYVYFLEGSAGGADSTITLRSISGSDTTLLKPGQAFRLGTGDETVRWIIGNHKGEGTIAGRLLMGSGEFFDNRISGSVEVIDGGKARTLANSAFSGAFGSALPGPGLYSRLCLFNAANSGKNAIIESVSLSAGNAIACNLIRWTAALSLDLGAGTSKNLSTLVSSTAVRCSTDSDQPTNTAGTGFVAVYQLSVIANGKDVFVPREPIIIAPGTGLLLWANNPTANFACSFEWFEEKI